MPLCHSETPSCSDNQTERVPLLGHHAEEILYDPSTQSFFDALGALEVKVLCDKRYDVYLKELFGTYWQDLFEPYFACITQHEPKHITEREKQMYAQIEAMFSNPQIMQLLLQAAVTWTSHQMQSNQIMPQEAVLGQYIANMPSALKKQLLCASAREVLSTQNEAQVYYEKSRYAYYAMLAPTLSVHDQLELLTCLDKMREEVTWGAWGENIENQLVLIYQMRHLLYQALGKGQQYTIGLYLDLQKKCKELEQTIPALCDLQIPDNRETCQFGPDNGMFGSDNDDQWRERFASGASFFPAHPAAHMFRRANKSNETVVMSYRELLHTFCPEVITALKYNNVLCAAFFNAHGRCCAGSMGLSPRGQTSAMLHNTPNQFLMAHQNSQCRRELERIFDTKIQVTTDMQRALGAPHLHESPLSTEQLRLQWPQELDDIIRLHQRYPDNDLVAVNCAEQAQTIALRLMCDAECVPKDIEKLLYQCMFSQWGLQVKTCPDSPESVHIASDGIRNLLRDQSQTSEHIPTCERMQPSNVFQLFSSHYDPVDKRSTIIVPNMETRA